MISSQINLAEEGVNNKVISENTKKARELLSLNTELSSNTDIANIQLLNEEFESFKKAYPTMEFIGVKPVIVD